MAFLLDGLTPEAYDRSYSDRQLLTRARTYFQPKLPMTIFIVVLAVLNSLVNTASPVLVARSIDSLGETMSYRRTGLLMGFILISGALSWILNYLQQRYTARMVGDVVLNVRKDAFAAAMDLDMSFHDEHPSGTVISRITSDTRSFATVVTMTLNLMSQSLLIIFITGVLFYISIRLALLTVVIALVIAVATLNFRRIARSLSRRERRTLARLNAFVQESIGGILIAKNFRQEQTIYGEFAQVNERRRRTSIQLGLFMSGVFPFLATLANLGTTALVYFGDLQVLGGAVTAGEFFLFIQSMGIFWFPLTSIASFWSQFQQGLAASERVFALIDADSRVVQKDQQPVSHLAGRIEFRDVDFQYTDQETVFKGLNLAIEAGETVALVGHTGAGKSSLGKLVARFYEFQGGQLLIDGRDIRTLDLHEYRRHFGIVPQVPFLLSGTIADNIRYPRPQATDKEVAAVAHQIAGGDWLEALSEGLETPVGELGKGLSMGQRQLVALARVLLQDPSIVILDEATASVDPLTEAQIREALAVALEGRTAIIIAHRLSTVRNADRIVALRRGQIIEEGSHDELVERGGYYAELYNAYFRHQSPDYEPEESFAARPSLRWPKTTSARDCGPSPESVAES